MRLNRRYIDPQDEPPVAYCKVCYGELYRGDDCYPYQGEYICSSCAEMRPEETAEAPFTGEELVEMWHSTFRPEDYD